MPARSISRCETISASSGSLSGWAGNSAKGAFWIRQKRQRCCAGIGKAMRDACTRFIAISWPNGNPDLPRHFAAFALFVWQALPDELLCSAAHSGPFRDKFPRDIVRALGLVSVDKREGGTKSALLRGQSLGRMRSRRVNTLPPANGNRSDAFILQGLVPCIFFVQSAICVPKFRCRMTLSASEVGHDPRNIVEAISQHIHHAVEATDDDRGNERRPQHCAQHVGPRGALETVPSVTSSSSSCVFSPNGRMANSTSHHMTKNSATIDTQFIAAPVRQACRENPWDAGTAPACRARRSWAGRRRAPGRRQRPACRARP